MRRASPTSSLDVRPGLCLTYRGNGLCLAVSNTGCGTFGVYRIDTKRGLVLVDSANSDMPIPVLYLNPADQERVESWAFTDDGWTQ